MRCIVQRRRIFYGHDSRVYTCTYRKRACGKPGLLSSNNQQSIKAVHMGNLGNL